MFPTRRITTSGGDVFRDEFSLAFDGTNDYLNIGTGLDLGTGDFTISIWAKCASWGGAPRYLMGKYEDTNNRWYIRIKDDDPPRLQLYTKIGGTDSGKNGWYGNNTVGPSLDDLNGQWVHFCISSDRDGNNMGYINSVFNDTDSASTATMNNDGDLEIARYDSTEFGGNISEVTIYNKALTTSEVKTIYNGREPYNHKEGIASANLKAWWRMGDGVFDGFPIVQDQANTNIGSNLVPNPTFDTNTTGWESYSGGSGDDNTLSRETSITHSGSGSLKIVYAAGNGGWGAKITGNITATANKLLIMEGYVYIPSGSYSGGNPILVDGGGFSSATTQIQVQANSSITNEWQYMRTVQILSSDATGTVFLHTTGTDPSENDILYWDDISCRVLDGNAGAMYNMTASDFEGESL